MSGNLDLAFHSLDLLQAWGVREICVCAGARNAPIVIAARERIGLAVHSFFEERSAAFFALGRVQAESHPVAVMTTSGTAAAELLPAVVEAYYSGLPLIVVTADRPRAYRGTGAPQVIEQVGIFGPYAGPTLDLAESERHVDSARVLRSPVHLNLCFDEPLVDRDITDLDRRPEPVIEGARPSGTAVHLEKSAHPAAVTAVVERFDLAAATLRRFLSEVSLPLVLVGGLAPHEQPAVRDFLRRLGVPAHLEPLSGLREDAGLTDLQLHLPERISWAQNPFQGVLRLGAVPTSRLWRDLEDRLKHLPILSVSSLPFSGCTRSELIHTDLDGFLSSYETHETGAPANRLWPQVAALCAHDAEETEWLDRTLREHPRSEPGLFHALSHRMSRAARIYLGNSLPIREWALAAARTERRWQLGANRGANGIDGQVSSFLGFSRESDENWAVIGDLTALYDLSGPWALSVLSPRTLNLVVVNNGGGKIFDRMFKSPAFQNQHQLRFDAWAKLWSLPYECWEQIPQDLGSVDGRARMIEIRPDPQATVSFWAEWDARCRS